MKFKDAFIKTLREDPADAELLSHKLMLRAGMIQKVASGIYDYLPLGLRVIRKIENIIREEMASCGVSELLMPSVVPAELWQESGRWSYYGPELLRFKDRKNNEFCFGPTHEEVVVDVARKYVSSYRDLPVSLYQIQTKFRDEVRPRFGLMRGREFIMKDAYSFHANEESLEEMYWRMHKAYTRIFKRCGLEFRPVEADAGTIGGDVTHEFHVLADSGEDTILYCDSCDYAANIEKAVSKNNVAEDITVPSDAKLPEVVETPNKKTIEEVSDFLDIPANSTIKMLIYSVNDGEYLVGVCIRGDLDVNETKLRTVLGANSVEIPDESVVENAENLVVGFIGAYNFSSKDVRVIVADNSIKNMENAVCGANEEGKHFLHIYPTRDFKIEKYADVGFANIGDSCPRCDGGHLKQCKGIEVGQVFKLGNKYTDPMKMTFLDENGKSQSITMGCYGIGVGRTAAATIEQNNDKDGIIWPVSIAPFAVSILCLDPDDDKAISLADSLHDSLENKGVDVLIDDRNERPGVKFKDADLIGCPIRVVIGARGLKNGIVEIRMRKTGVVDKINIDDALDDICSKFISIGGNLRNS